MINEFEFFCFREGLIKMKEVYAKNQRFGDQQSAEQALRHNEERLQKCVSELKKYQELYNQVEQQYSCSSNNSNNSEYSSSSSTSGVVGSSGLAGNGGGNCSTSGQYQSPSQSSTLGGNGYKPSPYPGTPVSTNNNHHLLNGLDSNAVAYAVSPVSHLNTNATNGNSSTSVINSNSAGNPKMAPLVSDFYFKNRIFVRQFLRRSSRERLIFFIFQVFDSFVLIYNYDRYQI